MKKLSVLIALALVLTIGGAYATWTYATGSVQPLDKEFGISMGAKVENDSTAYGTYAVTSTPNFIVEPKDGTYNPQLIVNGASPALVITFTPDQNAPDTIKSSATPTKITISSTIGQYDGKDVITVKTAEVQLVWVKTGDTFTATIDAATFLTYLTLNETFSLDTPLKYTNYSNVLTAGKINVNVAAGNVAP